MRYFRYHSTVVGNILRKITFKPIESPLQGRQDEQQLLANLVGFMKQQALRTAERRHARLREIRGTLTIYTPRYNSSKTLVNVNIRDLTVQQVFNAFSMMIQSNRELTLNDVEFTFYYNRNQFIMGSGPVAKPSWWGGRTDIGWTIHTDDVGDINCAAFALAFGKLARRTNVRRDLRNLKIDARRLQRMFGWQEHVSISQFQQFVDTFPEYRVTILLLPSWADSTNTTFTGSEFQESEDGTIKPCKAIYIYYHATGEVGHYVYIDSIQSVIRKYRPRVRSDFCHKVLQS